MDKLFDNLFQDLSSRELEKQNNLHMSDGDNSFYEDQKDQHKQNCLTIESPDLGDFILNSGTKPGNETQLQVQVVF